VAGKQAEDDFMDACAEHEIELIQQNGIRHGTIGFGVFRVATQTGAFTTCRMRPFMNVPLLSLKI
jgi:hypothetical protein